MTIVRAASNEELKFLNKSICLSKMNLKMKLKIFNLEERQSEKVTIMIVRGGFKDY